MNHRVAVLLLLLGGLASAEDADMIVVIGAGGNEEYEQVFGEWADDWNSAAASSHIEIHEIGRKESDEPDRETLQKLIAAKNVEAGTPLWLVLIGHGTFDRNHAKFNLRGPDVSATELADWSKDFKRPLIVVNSFSSSGPFLSALQGERRVIITATRSGAEQNYSRFGGFLASSLSNIQADLDHDDQVSLLEAYLLAASQVARFYETESRLATEHSLLEDNGDGKGTPNDFFIGTRVAKKAKGGAVPDGRVAHRYILVPSENAPTLTTDQLAERDALETEIEQLRDRKQDYEADEYYELLEKPLLRMARLYTEASVAPKSEQVSE